MTPSAVESIHGAILGCAVGDALGLPYEGLSARRGARLWGEPTRHRFLGSWGMVSDDTEHTCLLAEALCLAPNDTEQLTREFAARLRWWLLGAPAGIGLATLQAILKLWCGYSPMRSGVYSAGNGPAMRSALLGAACESLEQLREFVLATTRITHTDPKAFEGALAVALAAHSARRGQTDPRIYAQEYANLSRLGADTEFATLLDQVLASVQQQEPTASFAQRIGCSSGVSGYVLRTVPVALHVWWSSPRDYALAVPAVIRCGGDTDTTAAIVGGIIGAGVGPQGIPTAWREKLAEWPRTGAWMAELAASVAAAQATGQPQRPPRILPGTIILRNSLFLTLVLGHLIRRGLPPY